MILRSAQSQPLHDAEGARAVRIDDQVAQEAGAAAARQRVAVDEHDAARPRRVRERLGRDDAGAQRVPDEQRAREPLRAA